MEESYFEGEWSKDMNHTKFILPFDTRNTTKRGYIFKIKDNPAEYRDRSIRKYIELSLVWEKKEKEYAWEIVSSLSSITRLPIEEAYSLSNKLSQYTEDSFTSFSRFSEKDFDGYYKKRIRTEEWLYNSFIELGGKPKNNHPLYFVFGESRYLNDWFENGIKTQLLLSDIDSEDISFTFGDSMAK